jgi:hypothetical protein
LAVDGDAHPVILRPISMAQGTEYDDQKVIINDSKLGLASESKICAVVV